MAEFTVSWKPIVSVEVVQREIRFIKHKEMLKYRHDLTQHGLQFSLPFCQNFFRYCCFLFLLSSQASADVRIPETNIGVFVCQ